MFITLNTIDLASERASALEARNETQLDDLERPIASVTEAPPVRTYECHFALSAIREFHARKPDQNGNPRTGTRIVFMSGAAQIVTESVAEVQAKIAEYN